MKILKILLTVLGITLLTLGFTKLIPLQIALFLGYAILSIAALLHIKKAFMEEKEFEYGMAIILSSTFLFNAVALFPKVIAYLI